VASVGEHPAAISGLAQHLTVVAVLPRLAGCLCIGIVMDDIVHTECGGEDWIQGGAG
jgi:hypothetical protein